jgi:transposase-like protein
MSDEPEPDSQAVAVADQDLDNQKTGYKNYSDEDKYTALAALDINGGNVYRTAIAYDLPYSTLYSWAKEREARGGGPSKLEKEKRGNLASKLEDKIHSVVESITPEVIRRATLSQRGVFVGIGVDKLKVLLGQGIDPDPAAELCRLLNLNRSQLPPVLELAPGEEIPEGFGPVINTVPNLNNPNSYGVEPVKPESDDNPEDKTLMDSDDNEGRVKVNENSS